jgi:hypothetical protein
MHAQNIALSPIEPRQHNYLIACSQAIKAFDYGGIEDEPDIGSAFNALLGRRTLVT